MIVAASVEECRQAIAQARRRYAIGFVPTMGALHEGHLSLVRRSTAENPFTVMSVYVNPTQFGPGEDLRDYPRPFEKDRALAEAAGVDLLWTPDDREIYPEGFSTFLDETRFSSHLCGRFRPGHFRGVCTVVFRLLQTVTPDKMYLGRKDAQQLRVLEKMADDLDLGVKVVGCPTVREGDGLAMSSRNVYLTPEERKAAPGIYRALREAETMFGNGERSSRRLLSVAEAELRKNPSLRVQYLELRRWSDFEETETVDGPALLATAVLLGKTRLIDNVQLDPREAGSSRA